MAELDPLLHAPARLQMLTTLSAVSEAEFATLRNALEVSDSVLFEHISARADVGEVRTRKGVQAGRRTTWIGLTGSGRKALGHHVAIASRLRDLPRVSSSQGWMVVLSGREGRSERQGE